MATIPDWKLQLLARRRQEEAAVRGREKAERERLSQMPAWKRGLLERRKAKLGLSPGEPGPVSGTVEAGPPDPDEPAVLLEAIGPVHQNRFIRQERLQQQQQRHEDLLAERRPGPLEARERRPSPGEARDQSPKGRESREERLSPQEAPEKRLGTDGTREASPRPSETRDWRPSPGEAGDQSSRQSEAQKWRLSPGEAPEQGPRRTEVVESKLSPRESGNQKPGLTEARKWRLGCGESLEQSSQWRPGSRKESRDCLEEHGKDEDDGTALPENPTRADGASGAGDAEAADPRSCLVEDSDVASKPTGGWKWTQSAGNIREWTPRDLETRTQKPEASELAEKRLGPPGVQEGEAEEEKVGALGRPLSALPNRCSVPSPLPPEDAGTGGPRLQEEEALGLGPSPPTPLSPPPPAPPVPQSPGDPLMNRLFYGVKSGVGGPRRSGHTFTVNPRRSAPPAAPATPTAAGPGTADAAAPGAGKKRYPTAEEILVLGGYLCLSRSCLVKGSPERHHKQLKISFSETALETTYQYPSESSVLEELGPEPEAPSTPAPPAAQPDEEEEEEEEELLLLQRELHGGLRTKALIVDESCRR